ncbi:type VI secretion system membrane subunit TssM [Actibacterium sp. 188UL27-1]|uniref:type VI secretion system membrane subunit TssM n=1 Tax=Actibacterium sp. 188UL27-1 TaxID=2786961 RepID=UPI00195D10DB|nr:type VI secretion system membrane subunit TssM [Actibacterium sp. 188UL27-1]MBM7068838.1 type VI secretion system membrane subunit TssM [Actibacterium sp. 188UL27-1]
MKKWIIGILVVLALISWAAVVWFAFPLIGFGETRPFDAIWVRILMISVVWLTVGTIYLIRFIRRRRAAKALEEAIAEPQITGDGEVLSERMTDALSVLKTSSGSKSFLYELPWYVIIGPPGSGKTTALLNSGIKFPLAEKGEGAVAGVGGTRYCDWWFSEEAVLIDTAGRYTTQDSDKAADQESWLSFLKLLKTHRTRQPINGVILAISLQEIMTDSPEQLEAHADTIRKRLMEIQDQLRVDFPVYLLLTKADLISGFMEYFGSFSASRRQKVWGHTFQTESKKEATVERFSQAFDELVGRLSEEVTDRLQEEPDGVNRIAIFGFPGQVAMLRDRLEGFTKGIFGHTRYKVNANLRGFYFSSGTQEGTPIDQVLGAMERNFGGVAAGGLMSGKGKSYFLHDLLRRVIFAEAGWVSTDRRAVRRAAAFRYGGYAILSIVTFGMIGLWGMSFLQNRELVRTAQAAIADYEVVAKDELETAQLSSFDLQEVLPYLDRLRDMPLGYGDTTSEKSLTERFGLSQRDRLRSASEATYRQALERMFRSRLILRVENELEGNIRAGEVLAVYESLKVYKLLGVDTAPQSDDDFVVGWFRDDWANILYPGPQLRSTREALEQHLRAMLELDAAREPSFELNGSLVDQAERTLARMNVADQAYSLILSTAEFSGIEEFTVVNRGGRDADVVFETVDGKALEELVIPALYTYRGFHEFFLPQLAEIAEALIEEQWVMGQYAEEAQFEEQISKVGPPLLRRYSQDWIREWDTVLNNIKLRPMAADKPRYEALSAASASTNSPILRLSEQIAAETKLTNEFSDPRLVSTDDAGQLAENVAGEVGERALDRFVASQTGLKRIGLDAILNNTKNDNRAGAAGGGGRPQRLPGSEIEQYYTDWHDIMEGEQGDRIADRLITTLGEMQRLLFTASSQPEITGSALPPLLGALKQAATRMPDPMNRMIADVVDDFEGDAANTSIARLNDALAQSVTQRCEQIISNRYPFFQGSERDVAIPEFSQLFAPNGVIDRFFLQELSQFADLSGANWTWKDEGPLAGKLSNATLKQFERAAAIRDAFFPTGSAPPNIQMTVRAQVGRGIDLAVLNVGGAQVRSAAGTNPPTDITWPGSGAGEVSLDYTPKLSRRENERGFGRGAWSFLRFLKLGQPRVKGNEVVVAYNLDGREMRYLFVAAANESPFFIRELVEFKCPKGL